MSTADADLDPSVCYRHPDRTSWVLCTRCGKTICPECQILTPSGVQCPDCVRETGGSVRWEPAQARPPKRAAQARVARATRSARSDRSDRSDGEPSRWRSAVGQMLRPGGETPVLTWGVVGLVLILWLVGLFSANAPLLYLAALPNEAWQVWRYFTSAFAYIAALDFVLILSLLINILFFLLIAPSSERQLGRNRFALVFFAATAAGSACMILAGGVGYGLIAPLWGLLGAYLVAIWEHPAARTQFLIILAINAVFSLVLGGSSLPALIGGLLAGVGVNLLLRRADSRPRSRARTPYLITGAGLVVLIGLAILRTVV